MQIRKNVKRNLGHNIQWSNKINDDRGRILEEGLNVELIPTPQIWENIGILTRIMGIIRRVYDTLR